MKSRSHRPSVPQAPMEDWVNGSWTVDCPCGVTFDDGEEMVDCDECGVWVHTRCSRFVREEASFTCEKCEVKKARFASPDDQNNANNVASATNNEETEVAQLLAELPTKADPCPPSAYQRIRLWTDIPMEKRVHVHGVPGVDPSLFQGLPSIFTSELWNCTGYVPKKFNFKYKEFPCWDDDESENPANTGADLLFSLSKESMPYAEMETFERNPSSIGLRKRDGKVLSNSSGQSSVKKERNKLRGFGVCTNKWIEEEITVGRDKSGKKKAMPCGYKAGLDGKKADSTPVTVAKHSVLNEDSAVQDSKSDLQDVKIEDKGADLSSEPTISNHFEGINTSDNPKNTLVITAPTGVLSSAASIQKLSLGIPVKVDNLCDQDSVGLDISSRTDDTSTSTQATSHIDIAYMKKEDVSSSTDVDGLRQLNNRKSCLGNLNENSSSVAEKLEKSKPATGELKSIATSMPNPSIHHEAANASSRDPMEAKSNKDSVSEDGQPIGNSELQSSPVTGEKSDVKRQLTANLQKLVAHSSEDLQMSEMPGGLAGDVQEPPAAESEPEARHRACDRIAEEIVSITCEHKLLEQETKEPERTPVVQEDRAELGHASKCSEEPCKSGTRDSKMAGGHKVVVAVGKAASTSSVPDISKLPLSGNYKSPGTTLSPTSSKAVPFTKGAKLNANIVGKKDNAVSGVSGMESMRGAATRQPIKTHQRGPGSSGDKSSQTSKTIHASASKHKATDSKERPLLPSSETSATENSASSSGSGKPAGSSQTQSTSAQMKFKASGLLPKNERITSPTSQTSGKVFSQSTAMHPPSSANSSATLSDEELAKRLHQELNSSPRVSRVPRGLHAGGMQFASSTASSMLSKRSSSSGGKAQVLVSKRKNKEDTSRDNSRGSHEPTDATNKLGSPPSAHKKQQESILTDDSAKRDTDKRLHDVLSFAKKSDQPASSTDDDSGPIPRTLPGLVYEIMSEGKRMTYEELCDAVLPHWQNLRKPNGERYAYSSHSLAVLDCLRNRNEWSHLIDRGPKTNSSKKRRALDADSVEEPENRTANIKVSRSEDDNNDESCREDFPKGKRKARKRRRLALQGRNLKEVRERQKQDATSEDDFDSFSQSGDGESQSVSSEDEMQGARSRAVNSGTSSSPSEDSD